MNRSKSVLDSLEIDKLNQIWLIIYEPRNITIIIVSIIDFYEILLKRILSYIVTCN